MATKPKRRQASRSRGGFWKDTFVPHKGNGHHPHILRGNVIIGAIVLVLIIEVGILAQTFYFGQTQPMTASVLPAVVADLTNQQRADNGISVLAVSPLLTQAAQDKANDMAAKGYFAHVSPSGQLPWYWFQQVGYNYQFAGENLAVNFTDSTDLVNAWMNSPMHRANILKQDYTQIGIGIAEGQYQGQQTTFVVEFFGTPEPAASSVAEKAATPAAPVKVAAAAPAPAQQNPAQVSPAVPVETAVPASVPIGTPQVLGTEAQPAQSVSWWMQIVSSPRTFGTYFLLAIGAFFAALLILSMLPVMPHLPHPNAFLNGAALLAVIFGIMVINQNFLSNVRLNTDSQNASVAAPLVR